MTMMPPGGGMPPRGMPPAGGPPVGGMPPQGGAGMAGQAQPIIQAIMRMLPPQLVQQIASNPAIIPQIIQKFMPMVLGGMRPPGGGGMPPGGGGGGMPPPQGMPPRGLPFGGRQAPPFARKAPAMGGAPPAAFSGNGPPQPSSQGSIQPMSTEDELAMAQQQMGSKKPGY